MLDVSGVAVAGIMSAGQGLAAFAAAAGRFALQMALIIGAGKLFGRLLKRLGQPSVVGEVVGGIVLGPSVMGLLFPEALAALFPAASLGPLKMISQAGLALFMFTVGLELDTGALKKHSGAAAMIAYASIVVPFTLGAALALVLFTGFAPAGVAFAPFAMFMGVAMSVTAFPVLARILHERGMTKTPLGSLALASAAIDDVTSWGILALVIGLARGGSGAAGLEALAWTAGYVGLMAGVVRPLLGRWFSKPVAEGRRGWPRAATALAFMAASAWLSELAGLHAIFGAFFAGVLMPRAANLGERLAGRLQGLVSAALLPVFFALTGLRTQIGLIDDAMSWGVAGLVLAAAVAGKLGGGALAARFSGLKWRDALSIGALMNTRGLVELVVLNIGYDLGIISGRLFAILVLMALITTAMTGPLLSWFAGKPAPESLAA